MIERESKEGEGGDGEAGLVGVMEQTREKTIRD